MDGTCLGCTTLRVVGQHILTRPSVFAPELTRLTPKETRERVKTKKARNRDWLSAKVRIEENAACQMSQRFWTRYTPTYLQMPQSPLRRPRNAWQAISGNYDGGLRRHTFYKHCNLTPENMTGNEIKNHVQPVHVHR